MTADKTSKAAQFITKHLQLTQEKRIEWKPERSPRNDSRTAFVADVEGKTLRLYKYSRQVQEYDLGMSLTPRARTRMIETTCLEVMDDGLVTYTFEDVSGLWDLYESVAYAASNVDALMDAILERT